jgi:hypothetical protein
VLLALGSLAVTAPAHAAAAPSSTTITLSSTESPYGKTVTASAAVAVSSGRAEGDVLFVIDGGAPVKANLGATGTARIVLPDLPVGEHQVSATFAPQFVDQQQPSTSPAQPWSIDRARTDLQVRVIGRGARIPTSVRVQADGDFGTRPTGSVRVAVKRIGSRSASAKVSTLPNDGVVLTRFGKLRQGRYRAIVTYDGDSQHLNGKRVQWFRVVKR